MDDKRHKLSPPPRRPQADASESPAPGISASQPCSSCPPSAGGAPEAPVCAASPAKRKRPDDGSLLRELAEELDCPICSKLLHEPVSTPCGHTFCRGCLARALDFRDSCPLCRTVLHLEEPAALPTTVALDAAIKLAFPDASRLRAQEAAADAAGADGTRRRLPLFPLNSVVFPGQSFTMHIYEARYRLMLRRIMAGSRKFGLVALRPAPGGFSALCDVGCVLEVARAHRMPDGRSLIETVARERFKVLNRSELDGYLVGRTEVFRDTQGLEGAKVREAEIRARGIIAALMEQGSKLGPGEESRLSSLQDALRRTGEVPREEEGPSALGLWLAGVLVADKRERQRLLEMNDATKRLVEMTAVLEQFRDSIVTVNANATDSPSNRECCIQ